MHTLNNGATGAQTSPQPQTATARVLTVAEVADRLSLRPEKSKGKTEYKGANPAGAGATKDGFILNEDGTAYDRKLDRRYTSRDVADLAQIAPETYEPYATWLAGRADRQPVARPAKSSSASARSVAPKASKAVRGKPVTNIDYDYTDEAGKMLYRVNRKDYDEGEKTFFPSHIDAQGRRVKGYGDGARVLYRLPKIAQAKTVYLCEGEKCADRLNDAFDVEEFGSDFAATSAPGGANAWHIGAESYAKSLQGKRVFILPDEDEVGKRHAQTVARSLATAADRVAIIQLPDLPNKGDVCEYLDAGGTVENLFDLAAAAPVAQIETKPDDDDAAAPLATEAEPFEFSTDSELDDQLGAVQWLWPGYIPKGFPTLIVGPQDGGKSTVAQDFCRTLLNGGRWPDGTQIEASADKLLWIDTEGSLAIFLQRLKAWGMPRGRFILPKDPTQEINLDSPADWNWVERAIEKFRPPLVVIDALSGAHSTEENSNDGMKPLLKKLCALAQKYGIAIVLIHHLNKGLAGVEEYPLDLNRIRGASTISQFCRSVLGLTLPDKTQPDARRLDVIKLNLARKPAPVGYVLTDDGPAWGVAPQPAQPRRAADDAADFLREALASGKRPAADVIEEAKERGISDRALRQARELLHVKNTKGSASKTAGWNYELPLESDDESSPQAYP